MNKFYSDFVANLIKLSKIGSTNIAGLVKNCGLVPVYPYFNLKHKIPSRGDWSDKIPSNVTVPTWSNILIK